MMKRYTAIYMILAFLPVVLAGCTCNNGDIGDWFGTWRLESMNVGQQDDDSYNGDVLWKFQNNIIEMVRADDVSHTCDERFGTWQQSGDILILDFGHSDDMYPAGGEGRYAPLDGLYIQPGQTQMSILELSGSRLRLRNQTSDGLTVIYNFKKWG